MGMLDPRQFLVTRVAHSSVVATYARDLPYLDTCPCFASGRMNVCPGGLWYMSILLYNDMVGSGENVGDSGLQQFKQYVNINLFQD